MRRLPLAGLRARLLIVSIVFGLGIAPSYQASASPTKKLLNGFSKEISDLERRAIEAQERFTTAKNENDKQYLAEIVKLEDGFTKATRDINTNLKPRLDAATKSLSDAKSKWTQVNKVKLTTGFFGSDLSRINNVLDCIAPYSDGSSPFLLVKRYCANNGNHPKPGDRVPGNPLVTYGGADWQKDDVTTVDFVNANDRYLVEGIKVGFVVPLNPQEFESTRLTIATSQTEIERFTNEIAKANKDAVDTRDLGKFNAREQFVIRLGNAEDEYERESANIQNQVAALVFGQKAAKRAARQGGNLKASFNTALQFAYNVQRLDEIAREPLEYITSLKALNSVVKITALSEEADEVDSSYTNQKAARINQICGKVFIKEAKFRELNSAAQSIYARYVGR